MKRLKDLRRHRLTDVALAMDGTPVFGDSPPISADGRFVPPGKPAVFLKDLRTGAIRRIPTNAQGAQANRQSAAAALSGDGHVFSFESDATHLVEGDLNGKTRDVFVGPARGQ